MKTRFGIALIVLGFLMAGTHRPSGCKVIDRAAASKITVAACVQLYPDGCHPTSDCPGTATGVWKAMASQWTREVGALVMCQGTESSNCERGWTPSGCTNPPL